MTAKKYFDATWNFIGANTKNYTHCYHAYPAMMIPQIAERLITKYKQQATLLFDPYCGTGTSLVEANLQNINAIGTDLNPLARLISETKTTRINLQVLDLYLKEFNNYLFSFMFGVPNVNIIVPKITNMDYWFEPSVQEKLAFIKHFIESIAEKSVQNFFKVAFSETVRESSWTRNGEFKMFRMTAESMAKFKPDVFGLMQSKLARNHQGLKLWLAREFQAQTQLFSFNTVEKIEQLEAESVDLVVTSPPYGDSRTTVAYGQFSRLANQWLDIDEAMQIDNRLMGGARPGEVSQFDCNILNQILAQVAEKEVKRAQEVSAFYVDYEKSITNVAATIKPGGHACYVVGNRKVKGVTLPTDEITKTFFEAQGFAHVETIIRDIPNKRMPSRNSPSNVTGEQDNTMCNEFIVVLRKG